MKMLKWDDIVSDLVKGILAVIVVGAATIVWQGATSVETKVNESKAELKHMIEGSANEIATLKADIDLLKTNLQILRSDIPGMIDQKTIYGPQMPQSDALPIVATNNVIYQMQQKVYQSDLVDKLQLKK
jgi:hypothetical protein